MMPFADSAVAANWAVAGGTALLAVATFVLALISYRQGRDSKRLAKATELQAKLLLNESSPSLRIQHSETGLAIHVDGHELKVLVTNHGLVAAKVLKANTSVRVDAAGRQNAPPSSGYHERWDCSPNPIDPGGQAWVTAENTRRAPGPDRDFRLLYSSARGQSEERTLLARLGLTEAGTWTVWEERDLTGSS